MRAQARAYWDRSSFWHGKMQGVAMAYIYAAVAQHACILTCSKTSCSQGRAMCALASEQIRTAGGCCGCQSCRSCLHVSRQHIHRSAGRSAASWGESEVAVLCRVHPSRTLRTLAHAKASRPREPETCSHCTCKGWLAERQWVVRVRGGLPLRNRGMGTPSSIQFWQTTTCVHSAVCPFGCVTLQLSHCMHPSNRL